MAELPRCETLRDIQTLSGRRVLLVGIYQQVDMRMRPKPPPVYRGHVAVTLIDGTQVLLEPNWSQAAIRSPEERENHEGRRVEVTGIIHEESPAPPEMAAYTTGPVLSPVERIQPAQ
ncbi:hypothetical protein ACN28E_06655 [Archangium lansingense]|uniref:hypothetical protein n=1 Tax=Archangium lansingense TaxID=2995310 RepID=UPI003B7AB650